MTCEHLRELDQAIAAHGIRETFRGEAWSRNCREWVYYECYLDLEAIRTVFQLSDCVREHMHRGTHDGEEKGLICDICKDGIMGHLEKRPGIPVFPCKNE